MSNRNEILDGVVAMCEYNSDCIEVNESKSAVGLSGCPEHTAILCSAELNKPQDFMGK